jgi:hypothetical protein
VALHFDPEPHDTVEAVFARENAGDHDAGALGRSLDQCFDALEAAPRPSWVRRRYLRPPGLWMVTIHRGPDEDDWAVLWDEQHDDVWVRYVGPASFA